MTGSSDAKQIENFDVKLKKTDEGFLIEAEDKITGDEFKKLITDELIKNISHDSIFDLDTIHDILQNYKKDEKESLSITKDGKLTYSCQVMLGGVNKRTGFSIDLEKQILEPHAKLRKSLIKLSLRVSKLEERLNCQSKDFALNENIKMEERLKAFENRIFEKIEAKDTALEEMMKVNEERFNAFEKKILDKLQGVEKNLSASFEKIKILEQSPFQILDCYFNPAGEFAAKYTLSENNKAAKAKGATKYVLFALNPLPIDQKCEFSFIIGEPYFVMVGIAPGNCQNNREICDNKAIIGFGCDGTLYPELARKLPEFVNGDKITFHVDLFL